MASWYGNLNEGETLSVNLKVLSGGPIDVMILDSEGYADYNYNLGGGKKDVTSLYHTIGVTEYTKEFKAEETGKYYVVVDNTEFPVEGTSPEGEVSVKVKITKK